YARGGGIQNDAMGEYSIAFTNGGIEYAVSQSWSLARNEYRIGLEVIREDGAVVSMEGDADTQVGALTLLDGNLRLPNRWLEQPLFDLRSHGPLGKAERPRHHAGHRALQVLSRDIDLKADAVLKELRRP